MLNHQNLAVSLLLSVSIEAQPWEDRAPIHDRPWSISSRKARHCWTGDYGYWCSFSVTDQQVCHEPFWVSLTSEISSSDGHALEVFISETNHDGHRFMWKKYMGWYKDGQFFQLLYKLLKSSTSGSFYWKSTVIDGSFTAYHWLSVRIWNIDPFVTWFQCSSNNDWNISQIEEKLRTQEINARSE